MQVADVISKDKFADVLRVSSRHYTSDLVLKFVKDYMMGLKLPDANLQELLNFDFMDIRESYSQNLLILLMVKQNMA